MSFHYAYALLSAFFRYAAIAAISPLIILTPLIIITLAADFAISPPYTLRYWLADTLPYAAIFAASIRHIFARRRLAADERRHASRQLA